MTVLPEPPADTTAGQAAPTDDDRDTIRRLFAAVDEIAAEKPTAIRIDDPNIPSWEDGARIGDTPPVPQPDSRIVPAWAAGIAVASIGAGAGVTGIGCGAWLALRGLAAVTLNSVLMVTLPIAAAAVLVTAIGAAISRARSAVTTNIYKGTVYQDRREVHSKTIGAIARTTNRQ